MAAILSIVSKTGGIIFSACQRHDRHDPNPKKEEAFLKHFFRRLFCLSLWPTLIVLLIGFGTLIAVAIMPSPPAPLTYFSFGASAYALVVFLTACVRIGARIRKRLVQKVKSTRTGGRLFGDLRFRNALFLALGLMIDIVFIIVKLIAGFVTRSYWFISLAVYYLLLVLMRCLLLRRVIPRAGETLPAAEYRVYRRCGVVLLVMNQALTVIVVAIVQREQGFVYPGMMIYAMAFYAFYSIITAAVKLLKYRRLGSPLLSAAKVIGFVKAMVSMLALTTAMLAQFGAGAPDFRRVMTAAVGGGVCTVVLLIALFMIVRASRSLARVRAGFPR